MSNGGNRVKNHVKKLFHTQNGKCYWCDEDMFLREDVERSYFVKHRTKRATFDHIKTKSTGGTYRLDNGVCACFECNNVRGNMTFDKFKTNAERLIQEWKDRQEQKAHRRKEHRLIAEGTFSRKAILSEKRRRNQTINSYLLARFAFQISCPIERLMYDACSPA